MTISEKVSYLKGLAEGMKLDPEASNEAKLISVMIGILEEIGLSLEDMEENLDLMGEELDTISDDLSDVEDVVYDRDVSDDTDQDFFEVQCPDCGAAIDIDSAVLEAGKVDCPNCGSTFAVDLSDEEEKK